MSLWSYALIRRFGSSLETPWPTCGHVHIWSSRTSDCLSALLLSLSLSTTCATGWSMACLCIHYISCNGFVRSRFRTLRAETPVLSYARFTAVATLARPVGPTKARREICGASNLRLARQTIACCTAKRDRSIMRLRELPLKRVFLFTRLCREEFDLLYSRIAADTLIFALWVTGFCYRGVKPCLYQMNT